MSTSFLIVRPKIGDNKTSEDAKVNIEQENNSSSNPAKGSKSCATSSTTTKPKNDTERGEAKRGDAFHISGNKIEGSNSVSVEIFMFGNKNVYKGHKKEKQVDSRSGEKTSRLKKWRNRLGLRW
ncbi:unnamed protein product [Prunus armeniaca]|uniref:Uncharacterized protein n=1 Tax=Prunus armeniaca TaxID=36596 RepID=A0A6J5VYQ3_PRUAR|nr:unnamed protein product [Prunus armeniaca]CAB4293151.1 unnamed protein product [Prunus armeniaca]